MPKRLHYLSLADYGKNSIAASTAILDNGLFTKESG